MKIEGSGSASGSESGSESRSESGSGSISQRHGSADPDPHQNVMDPEHWTFLPFSVPDIKARTQAFLLLLKIAFPSPSS